MIVPLFGYQYVQVFEPQSLVFMIGFLWLEHIDIHIMKISKRGDIIICNGYKMAQTFMKKNNRIFVTFWDTMSN